MDELLNVEMVNKARKEKGTKVCWLIEHLELSRSSGYLMFRKGLLPEDRARRKAVLQKLASYLGLEVPQILLTPGRPSRRTA